MPPLPVGGIQTYPGYDGKDHLVGGRLVFKSKSPSNYWLLLVHVYIYIYMIMIHQHGRWMVEYRAQSSIAVATKKMPRASRGKNSWPLWVSGTESCPKACKIWWLTSRESLIHFGGQQPLMISMKRFEGQLPDAVNSSTTPNFFGTYHLYSSFFRVEFTATPWNFTRSDRAPDSIKGFSSSTNPPVVSEAIRFNKSFTCKSRMKQMLSWHNPVICYSTQITMIMTRIIWVIWDSSVVWLELGCSWHISLLGVSDLDNSLALNFWSILRWSLRVFHPRLPLLD